MDVGGQEGFVALPLFIYLRGDYVDHVHVIDAAKVDTSLRVKAHIHGVRSIHAI